MGRGGEQVGRIEGLNIVSLLKSLLSCGTTPKNSAEKGGGAGIYPLSNWPLPFTLPHPSHGQRRSVPWMGVGGGKGGGGGITSLSPGWAIELGFKDRPKIFLLVKLSGRFSLEK